jgi:acetyltransferase-like isoleucine patch superfamily enzyme
MLTRTIHAALGLPGRLKDHLYCKRLRAFGRVAPDALLFPTTRFFNSHRRPDAIRIGSGTMFHGEINIVGSNGSVTIGEWSFVGPGAKLWSRRGITVGNDVQISHGVQIFDNNSHSLSARERAEHFRALSDQGGDLPPEAVRDGHIVIEDDVWIGFNAAIMKGVTVGRGAVVAAGAIVTRDVPAYTTVAGNPAREVGKSAP